MQFLHLYFYFYRIKKNIKKNYCSYIRNSIKNLTLRISTASKYNLKVHSPCAKVPFLDFLDIDNNKIDKKIDNKTNNNKTNNRRLTIT